MSNKKRGINLEISDEDKEAFKKSHLDFIGVNYYGKLCYFNNRGKQ